MKLLSLFSRFATVLRGLLRPLCIALFVIGAAAGPAAYWLTRPAPVGVVGLSPDASASDMVNYTNTTIAYANEIISRLPEGAFLRLIVIGGANQQVYAEPLTGQASVRLRSQLTASHPLPSTVQGSDITTTLLGMAWQLKQRPEPGRRVLFYLGDGLENQIRPIRQFRPGIARGVQVCILFPRSDTPLCAEALQAAGATVTVARTQSAAQAAIDHAVTGTTSRHEMLRLGALVTYESVFIVLLIRLIALWFHARWKSWWRAKQPVDVDEEVPVEPELSFAPQVVRVRAELAGQPRSIVRSLQVGTQNGFFIAGENATRADMSIPESLLGFFPQVAIEVSAPEDALGLQVTNCGQSPVVADGVRLRTGQSSTVLLNGGSVLLGPEACIVFSNAAASPATNGGASASRWDTLTGDSDLDGDANGPFFGRVIEGAR